MLLIIVGSLVGLFLIASFLPIWGIKWKYADPSKATVDPSGDYSNVPKNWMCSEDKNTILWFLLFGTVDGVKERQGYFKIYSLGANINCRIGLSIFD